MRPPYSPSGEGSETAENVTYHPAAEAALLADDLPPQLTADDLRDLPVGAVVESRYGNLLRRFSYGWCAMSERGNWDLWSIYSDHEVVRNFGPRHICTCRGKHQRTGVRCHLHAPAKASSPVGDDRG